MYFPQQLTSGTEEKHDKGVRIMHHITGMLPRFNDN